MPQTAKDDVTLYFDEYFAYPGKFKLTHGGPVQAELDPMLAACLKERGGWPPDCCVCPTCLDLDGNRNPGPSNVTPHLRRLFIGDLVWLYHFDWMGIFRILGVILDDFATRGRFPISNGSITPGSPRDELVATVLEVMVQETKKGLSSTLRDRESSFRRCLGWKSEGGGRLKQETQVNDGFSKQFHKFVYHALEFYKDRRLAVAIRGAASPAAPASAATLVTLSNTMDVLKKRFEVFDYGRNFFNTLNGIVWAIAGMAVVREIRTTLGIPPAYERPHEYLPAAYELLVAGRPVTGSETNRYTLHRACARNARDVLLDIEVLNNETPDFALPAGELDRWLTQVEGRIEAYRTAYRTLTGIDLGETAEPAVPHRA